MTDVATFHKPEPEACACACGCGLIGRPKVKAWANGVRCNKGCKCRRCVGGRQTPKARKRENRIAKELGLERSVLSGALNGADLTGYLDIEETANEALVRGLRRWYQSQQIQTKLARLHARPGDAPKAFVASWDGRPQLMVFEYTDGARMALAASEEPEDGKWRGIADQLATALEAPDYATLRYGPVEEWNAVVGVHIAARSEALSRYREAAS